MVLTKGQITPREIALVADLRVDESIRKTRSDQVSLSHHDPAIDILDPNSKFRDYYPDSVLLKKIPDPAFLSELDRPLDPKYPKYLFMDKKGNTHASIGDVYLANDEIYNRRFPKKDKPYIFPVIKDISDILKKPKDGKPY